MNKRYLLVIKNRYSIDTMSFYTIEEAKAVAKNMVENTIIDLEDKNITWQMNQLLEWQGFFGQILCRVIISVLYWC